MKKKNVKKLCITLSVILLVLLSVPLWLGPVVKFSANQIVPRVVKTDFNIEGLKINPYSGALSLRGLSLANPEGFRKENCVELSSLDIKVDLGSVSSNKIIINNISLDGLVVAVEDGGDNFKAIINNVSGDKASETSAEVTETKTETPTTEGESEKRVQIDRLQLKNIKVKIGRLPIILPTVVLENIGADKEEGATLADVWFAIQGAIGNSLKAIGDFGVSAVEATGKAVSSGIDAVGSGAKATGEAVSSGIDAVSSGAKATGEAISSSLETTGKAIGAGVDSIKGIFKSEKKNLKK